MFIILIMQIIELTKESVNVASEIYVKSWKAAYSGIAPQRYLDELTVGNCAAVLENSPLSNVLLEDKGVFVATGAYGKARDGKYGDYGEIVSVYVLPEHFGKGYGTVLFDFMTGKLRSMGMNKICLWVLEENSRARRFYEKMGFVPNGDKITEEIGNKELSVICYVNKI